MALLVKSGKFFARISMEDLRLVISGKKVFQMVALMNIIFQVFIAIRSISFAEEPGRAMQLDSLVDIVRRDIATMESKGKNASDDRLKWWICGIVGPEWLEDHSLEDGGREETRCLTPTKVGVRQIWKESLETCTPGK
jgi:hypothetical protein